ncbi:hypothetical protein [Stackebrandtia nassauensis]|uniref:Lipoprotein n=1 Tax=Stackebrandtia nassauensis (strain DSM 44728 / CIP 108903 / NRRL B-16338 / NBRC 102104 / LLR-40K-21) TaxID=446470 RepID=D3PYV5_STANL|nr:hypothetical protein [Stackebrandtia nassauensis]ADD43538.1 hypothetical protein Snas_3883 [Stackebrandtia nassauensis DSM 44728]
MRTPTRLGFVALVLALSAGACDSGDNAAANPSATADPTTATRPDTDAGASEKEDEPGSAPESAKTTEPEPSASDDATDGLSQSQRELLAKARRDGEVMVIVSMAEGSQTRRYDRVAEGVSDSGGAVTGGSDVDDSWLSAMAVEDTLWFLFGSGDVASVVEDGLSEPT